MPGIYHQAVTMPPGPLKGECSIALVKQTRSTDNIE